VTVALHAAAYHLPPPRTSKAANRVAVPWRL
jgi:hypothetical protein